MYTQALTEAGSYRKARDLCQRIRAPNTRGDCRLAAMEQWQQLDVDECEAINQGAPELALWRDECMFQLAERLRAAGQLDEALVACVQTRFARQCSWHLVQDDAEASLQESPAVAEQRITRYADAQRLPDAALQFWIIRFRTAAAAGVPADSKVCETLVQPQPCQEALARHVRLILDARLRAGANGACQPRQPELSWVDGEISRATRARWVAEHCSDSAAAAPPVPRVSPAPESDR